MYYDVIIAGGGASGLMLAAGLELNNGSGLILEKTQSVGTKLLMSGGGRCNITHGGSIKNFVNCYGDAGTRLRRCLYRHSNAALAEWLEDGGIPLADERGNSIASDSAFLGDNDIRIFPESMKASDVLGMLLGRAKHNGWEIRTEAEVYSITRSERDDSLYECWEVKASPAETFRTSNLVIATGGITYPETGSDGSMFRLLDEDLGIPVTEMRPALAPIRIADFPYDDLAGISVPDVTVTVFGSDAASTCKGKSAKMTGDLLMTHHGFSGPVILNISRYAEPGQMIRLSYNKELGDLPRRMQKMLEERAKGPSGDVRTTRLAALLDADEFVIESVDEHGMVTAGGIDLDCIDMGTMRMDDANEPAIYAIGEAIDADGITGGYNLQMCWSTAMTAADDLRTRIADVR